MTTTTVALVSLGCPKNLVDSEKILGQLAEHGCIVGAEADSADVIVVNTCGFLSAAREESLGVIREALALKRRGRAKRVVVAGCLAQRDGQKLLELFPGVDAIVGVNNRDSLALAVLGEDRVLAVDKYSRSRPYIAADTGRLRLTPPHTAYLRISEGCGQGCSFCTIPAIRGPFRSKPLPQVLEEARELIADGAMELNVIGQDTTSYGRDLSSQDIDYSAGLSGLLRALNKLKGLRWIRLMYAYPSLITDDLMDAMAQCKRVVKYLDVPLQHVSDNVLRAMRRRITQRETLQLIERLRQRVPGIVLRTTFIVGFPGETSADFKELLQFVREARFDAMGAFEYSKEAGTPAARLKSTVPATTKHKRAETLMLAQQEIAFAANADQVGQPLEVLVDGMDAQGRYVAHHAGQAAEVDSVCLLTTPRKAGQFVFGTVVGTDHYDLVVRPHTSTNRESSVPMMNWKLPNQLTLSRLVLSMVFFVLLATSEAHSNESPNPDRFWLLTCFIIYIIAGITDILDGYLARRWNLTTVFGRIADPFADKVIVCGAFALLAGANFAFPGGQPVDAFERSVPHWLHGGMASGVQAWMVVVLIAREFIISGIRGYSESQGLKFPATPAGKIKMFVQSLAICTVLFQMAYVQDSHWAIILKITLVWLTVIVTVLSSLAYVSKARVAMRGDERA